MEDASFLDRILKLQRKANENPFMAFQVQTLEDEESDDDEEEECEQLEKDEISNTENKKFKLSSLPDKIV